MDSQTPLPPKPAGDPGELYRVFSVILICLSLLLAAYGLWLVYGDQLTATNVARSSGLIGAAIVAAALSCAMAVFGKERM